MNRLTVWNSSNIWELPYYIKMAFVKKLKTNRSHGMLAIIRCRIFFLPVCYPNKKNTRIKIYRTIILPVVLYGCETWSLTMKEKHGLRVSKTDC